MIIADEKLLIFSKITLFIALCKFKIKLCMISQSYSASEWVALQSYPGQNLYREIQDPRQYWKILCVSYNVFGVLVAFADGRVSKGERYFVQVEAACKLQFRGICCGFNTLGVILGSISLIESHQCEEDEL